MYCSKKFAQCVMALALCCSMAACDSMDSDQASMQYEGTPHDWWSDSYMTLVQDMNDERADYVAAKRPARIRLF